MSTNDQKGKPQIKFFTAEDGASLMYREWMPVRPKGMVVCLHGIRSHAAWYLDSCTHLYRCGYRVVFPDRRGSGVNREKQGQTIRYAQWITDTETLIEKVGSRPPDTPVHLMGISWGGRLAVAVTARGKARLKSLILSAPGLASLVDLPLRTKAAVALARVFSPRREFPLPLTDPSLFTDDPSEQNYIEEDTLSLRHATSRFFIESLRLERFARARSADVSVPVLLFLAGRDQIVDNEKVKKLFKRFKNADKIVKVFADARHTLEFDSRREEYFRDLAGWLDKH